MAWLSLCTTGAPPGIEQARQRQHRPLHGDVLLPTFDKRYASCVNSRVYFPGAVLSFLLLISLSPADV